jgi:hypothetical protein
VISSDFPPVDVIPGALGTGPWEKRSDPDDVQSMVRFLVYANEFRVEALIASAGTLANIARKKHVLDVLDRYEAVQANLRLHDPVYPTAQLLRDRTVQGLGGTYGKPASEIVGQGKDSQASRYIIELIDRPDPDPIWFCFWGGSQELAQALWRVRKERSGEAVKRFTDKIRVYLIAPQDGSAKWMMENFPELFVIFSERAFTGMFFNAKGGSTVTGDLAWLNKHVRLDHGALGAIYHRSGWNHRQEGVIEGDTPSFLYLFSGTRGLSDIERPSFGGWGGRFRQASGSPHHWVDSEEGAAAVTRWHEARQRDFAARMDWCVKPLRGANHAPVAVLNSDRSYRVLFRDASPGQVVRLDASGSEDRDGNSLLYTWWVYRESGSYRGQLQVTSPDSKLASVSIPRDAGGSEIHIVLEVTDNGAPELTSYRRLVIRVNSKLGVQ